MSLKNSYILNTGYFIFNSLLFIIVSFIILSWDSNIVTMNAYLKDIMISILYLCINI